MPLLYAAENVGGEDVSHEAENSGKESAETDDFGGLKKGFFFTHDSGAGSC